MEATRRAGLSEVEVVARAPLDFFDTGRCLRFPRQAQFHPLRYLNALVLAIEKRGGRLFTHAHAQEMKGGTPARVKITDEHIVTAKAVVVATNTPVNDWVTMHTKQAPYHTYVIAMWVPRESVPRGLYWDTPIRTITFGFRASPKRRTC